MLKVIQKNREFIIAGIRNLLKTNYHIEKDLIDVEAEVDASLTFEENWNAFKKKYHLIGLKETVDKIKSQEIKQ